MDVGRGADGKRKQKWTSGSKTEKDAEKALTEKLRIIDLGGDAFPDALTVNDYVTDKWLPHLRKQGRLRAGTVANEATKAR